MNTISRISIFLIATACNNSSDQLESYQLIMSRFKSYNYVIRGQGGNASEEESAIFKQDSLMYIAAIKEFYQSPRSIIDFLISNFENCEGPSGMLVPYSELHSSTLDPCELADCKIGALILIHNYLLNETRSNIQCSNYLTLFSGIKDFKKFKEFYRLNKELNDDSFIEAYKKEYVSSMRKR